MHCGIIEILINQYLSRKTVEKNLFEFGRGLTLWKNNKERKRGEGEAISA